MRPERTTLSTQEALVWRAFMHRAEQQQWKEMASIFPRLAVFPEGPAGREHGFKYSRVQRIEKEKV